MPRRPPPPVPATPPDAPALREAALAHLARYATTEARLRQVLTRRLDRWARRAAELQDSETIAAAIAAARPAIAAVVAALAAAGLLDDAAFAASRARGLRRAGRSRRAIEHHLIARGVAPVTARDSVAEDAEAELAAALLLARRRRLGPFRATPLPPGDPTAARRELAVLARAGFTESTARTALDYEPGAAEALVTRLRREGSAAGL